MCIKTKDVVHSRFIEIQFTKQTNQMDQIYFGGGGGNCK